MCAQHISQHKHTLTLNHSILKPTLDPHTHTPHRPKMIIIFYSLDTHTFPSPITSLTKRYKFTHSLFSSNVIFCVERPILSLILSLRLDTRADEDKETSNGRPTVGRTRTLIERERSLFLWLCPWLLDAMARLMTTWRTAQRPKPFQGDEYGKDTRQRKRNESVTIRKHTFDTAKILTHNLINLLTSVYT